MRPAGRIGLGFVAGLCYAVLTALLLRWQGPAYQAHDFTYPYVAARAVLHGESPYAVLARYPAPFGSVFLYPLPAAIVAMPLAFLPMQLAAALFVGVGAGMLCFAVTKDDAWRALILLSAPAYQAAWSVQWSPLLAAAALLPPLLGVAIVKLPFALPLALYQTNRRALWLGVAGGAALVLASFAVRPAWPMEWLDAVRVWRGASQYRSPLFTSWALLALPLLMRWRDRDARLVLGMLAIPQNFFFYDQLPLLLVARTRLEVLALVTCSWLAYRVPRPLADPSSIDYALASGARTTAVMLGLHAPAVALVALRQLRDRAERAAVDVRELGREAVG